MKKLYIVLSLIFLLIMTGCGIENITSIPSGSESVQEDSPKEVTQEDKVTEDKNDFPRVEVPVIRVIDGDTIKAMINGQEESVRFLLIDTPETNHPRMNGPQPFGKEAKEFVEQLLEGETVEIEMDIGERDKYGRLLAYLYVDGVSIQETLLQNGLARVAYIYPPNTRYVDLYQEIQEDAQLRGVGIWSVENYAQEDGYYPEFVDDLSLTSEAEEKPDLSSRSCHIKGNISSSGEKIYHMPEGMYYDRTNPEECFDTEKAAIKAGYRKSKR